MRLVWTGTVLTLALTLAPGTAEGQATIQLKALPGTVRVRPHTPVDGADVAEIAAARGETESFQVVITPVGGNLAGVEATMSPLRQESGVELPATCIVIHREVFVRVKHSSPRATRPPGLIPDPLVPFTNPYTGERIAGPRWDGTASPT